MWQEKLQIFDDIVDKCPRFERKGKAMIYTSANGYMFALLNKDGEIGIRFSNEVQENYITKFNTTLYKSYNAVMKGYVLIPEKPLSDLKLMSTLFNESYDYVMTLAPKTSKKIK
jgi:hypothetical protein